MMLLKSEKAALARLLEQGAETPQDLAVAVAKELDAMRAARTTYTVVLRFGIGTHQHHMCFGPYSTRNQASRAFDKHLRHLDPSAWAYVPTRTAEGAAGLLAETDAHPENKGDWAMVREDSRAFKRGWKGAITNRREYVQ